MRRSGSLLPLLLAPLVAGCGGRVDEGAPPGRVDAPVPRFECPAPLAEGVLAVTDSDEGIAWTDGEMIFTNAEAPRALASAHGAKFLVRDRATLYWSDECEAHALGADGTTRKLRAVNCHELEGDHIASLSAGRDVLAVEVEDRYGEVEILSFATDPFARRSVYDLTAPFAYGADGVLYAQGQRIYGSGEDVDPGAIVALPPGAAKSSPVLERAALPYWQLGELYATAGELTFSTDCRFEATQCPRVARVPVGGGAVRDLVQLPASRYLLGFAVDERRIVTLEQDYDKTSRFTVALRAYSDAVGEPVVLARCPTDEYLDGGRVVIAGSKIAFEAGGALRVLPR